MDAYVFLDPDGTQEFGVLAIVASPTGVTYAHQCGGLANELRTVEGFAMPLGGRGAAEPLVRFVRRWRGNPPDTATRRRVAAAARRRHAAASPSWRARLGGDARGDERRFLAPDADRVGDLTGAWVPWVPVRGARGPGVPAFERWG